MLRRVTLVSAQSALDDALAGGGGKLSPPLGLLTLTATLQHLLPISVVDLDHIWQLAEGIPADFRRLALAEILASSPDLIGFSTISGSYPSTIRLAQSCSVAIPGVQIVFGGPQASVVDTATLREFPFVDYVVRGEADRTFPRLVVAIQNDYCTSSLPGITYRSPFGVVRNPNAPPIEDLDELPLPAFEYLKYDLRNRALPIEAGRGCPFACTFCSTNDFFRRRFRLRSPNRILDDMRILNARYGTTEFALTHDMFTVDRKRVVQFCETMIAAGTPFCWSCSARTDCVDHELLELMAKAGCNDVFFGIETGSQRMQGLIQKNLKMSAVRETFCQVDAAGMRSTASVIVGYPEETPQDLLESVRFYGDMLRFSSVEPQFNILSPLAGTPLSLQYEASLYLDDEWSLISESGRAQTEDDRSLILRHPDIFQSFYAFPSQTPRPFLRRLRDFLYAGGVRCKSLLYALHLHTGNLLDVFEVWEIDQGAQPEDWYYTKEFIASLLAFVDRRYGMNVSAIRVAADFYRKLFNRASAPPIGPGNPRLRLANDILLIDCCGDVCALVRSFRDSAKGLDDAEINRPTTVVCRHLSGGKGVEVSQFPQATTELLRHVQMGSSFDEVCADFRRRRVGVSGFSTEQVVRAATEVIEQRGLVVAEGQA